MIKKQISILILLAVFTLSCSQQQLTTAKWQKTEYKQSNNIPKDDYWYNKQEKLMYLVTNDTENLYIHLKVGDNLAIRKILDFGFTVWVDINGKNKKNLGVKFPLAKMDRMPTIQFDDNQGNQGRRKRPSLDKKYNIELIGFNDKGKSSFIAANTSSNINGTMSFNEYDELEYNLTIPLKKIGISTAENKIISLNLESGSPNLDNSALRPSKGQGMQEGGEMGGDSRRGQGGGGGMQGGGGGGRQGGPGMGQSNMHTPTAIKIKIKKIELLFKEHQIEKITTED